MYVCLKNAEKCFGAFRLYPRSNQGQMGRIGSCVLCAMCALNLILLCAKSRYMYSGGETAFTSLWTPDMNINQTTDHQSNGTSQSCHCRFKYPRTLTSMFLLIWLVSSTPTPLLCVYKSHYIPFSQLRPFQSDPLRGHGSVILSIWYHLVIC